MNYFEVIYQTSFASRRPTIKDLYDFQSVIFKGQHSNLSLKKEIFSKVKVFSKMEN